MSEKYDTSKHQWGTDASTKYAKKVTPNESKKDGKIASGSKIVHSQKAPKMEGKDFFQLRAELKEATYQGKKVSLNKPMPGDVKKSKVYVDPDGDGKAKKVNFGDKNMTIKKNIPGRRKSFRARHNCDNPGPKDKARYWSCKAW